jgi:uncharacterized membrane protein YeiH
MPQLTDAPSGREPIMTRRRVVLAAELFAQIPMVLVTNIYASAALLGAFVVVVGRRVGLSPAAAAVLGFVACFAGRMAAVTLGWQLPKAV